MSEFFLEDARKRGLSMGYKGCNVYLTVNYCLRMAMLAKAIVTTYPAWVCKGRSIRYRDNKGFEAEITLCFGGLKDYHQIPR